ncbi:TetR/AcrR family transcriptional regulator [uncultured Desulfovibrio sp.]|uniref:TetR/AcrR family transcriptional regulator n=1 Tax=uncultured Desulfovibrio sp. TaxID=167968 RepID=UPI0026250584|nr:TetR/AcrR family transcriptional regulator [uncultured Desulfovibrio sp.]
MNDKSPSMNKICKVAVEHFARRGYDASSLNDIAEEVGIRKASLYSHVSGKNELFMIVFADALKSETEFVNQSFREESSRDLPGFRYCSELESRYISSAELRFLLRAAYFPPVCLGADIDAGYEEYLGNIFSAFVQRLLCGKTQDEDLLRAEANTFGHAYLGIVDSLHVKLIYTDAQGIDSRLQAMFRLLSDSLRLAGLRD